MRARVAGVALFVLALCGGCPRSLTLATCTTDVECESGYCRTDGICALGPAPGRQIPCAECVEPVHVSLMLPDGGAPVLPPHPTTGLADGVAVMDRAGNLWIVDADGGIVVMHRQPLGYSSPGARLPPSGRRPALWTARLEGDTLGHFFSLDGGVLEESLPAVISAAAHQAPVILSSDDAGMVAFPDETGQVVVTAAGATSRPSAIVSDATAGATFAAACRHEKLLVMDSPLGVSVLTYAFEGTLHTPVLTRYLERIGGGGAPVAAPIIVEEGGRRFVVYAFRNVPGAHVTRLSLERRDAGFGLWEPVEEIAFSSPLSGAPAVAHVGDEIRVVLPLASGALRVVRRDIDGELSSERWRIPPRDGGMALGGAVVLRLRPEHASDTIIVGDEDGTMMAIRDGVPLSPDAGWPFQARGAVRQPPVVTVHGERLNLTLLAERDGGVELESRLLGPASNWSGARVWPGYQHDEENSGCLPLAPR